MPAQKKTVSSLIGATLGTLGFSALAGVLVTVMVAPALAVTGMTASSTIGIFEGLPDYITLGKQKQQNEIYITGPDGNPLKIATVYDQNRQEVKLDQMSDWVKKAAIAGEDVRFYEHGGVDLQSLMRAGFGYATGSGDTGGSTLAMQTVRNILVQKALNENEGDKDAQEKAYNDATVATPSRKLKEIKLAISLAKQYSKDEILQGYLNIANFGVNTYGVQAAANQYFSVNASDLTIAQSASIIAITQSPDQLRLSNPDNYAKNQERRDYIIKKMYAAKFIDEKQRDEALATPVDANFVHITPPTSGCAYADPNYRLPCDYLRNSITELTSLGANATERKENYKTGGYKFFLSIDANAQIAARTVLQQRAPVDETRFQLGAAAATVQPGSGRILVMAQNKDFDDRGSTDTTTTAINYTADVDHGGSRGFQPGSTYKPITLLAYLEAGNGVNQSFDASVKSLPFSKFKTCGATPGGGSFQFRNDANESGPFTVARGTAQSVNSVFLQMATKVDQCDIADVAAKLGIHNAYDSKKPLQTVPICAIGTCDNNVGPLMMAAAYAAIVDHGNYCKPTIVDKIIAPDGTELPGQVGDCTQAIPANVADTAANVMGGVFASGGTAVAARPNDGSFYAGKTGTTDEAKQTWTNGATTAASTSLWVGNISGGQNLRRISVKGIRAAELRNSIFKGIATAVDINHKGERLPAADPNLLTGKPTIVPDVTGQTIDKAQPIIENADLLFADGGQIDSDQPAGTIVRTDPAGSSSVAKGTTVTVFTSNGQGKTVPDTTGQTLDQAKKTLNDAGFANVAQGQCTATSQPADAQPVVTAQTPAGGAMANPSTPITLDYKKFRC
ncbi:transglycosylase domain-containing protein [Schumannella luteola]|uniref:Membrane peptidoglycan carboxypeptidase n=1 Tax=Schumannella luteola TaxID=472059 RepID=A0A852YBA0_9MICO|nr:transglycosylase domain-containing protein [Schumannella luteola]NYG98630.1 membrane peptidoglycan carboxypeptidase [Schumannella luteola]TPX02601.1 PASTA domain-containing protein [Schumannella luteola]